MLETIPEHLFRSLLGTGILVFLSLLVLLGLTGLMIRKTFEEKTARWPLLLILLTSLGLSVFWIFLTQPVPHSDFQVYWQAAEKIHHGDLSFTALDRHSGSILFYAFAMSLFGTSLTVGWGVNLLFAAIVLLAVYRLSFECFNRKTALIATGMIAVLPQFVTYSALMATEVHAIAYTLVILWAAINSRRFALYGVLYWVALGVLIYGGVMVRASNLLLLGLIPLVLLVTRRGHRKLTLAGCAAMLITASLLISTWVYHQYLLTGIPKLFFTEYVTAFASQYNGAGGVSALSSLPYYSQYAALKDGTIAGEVRAREVLEAEAMKTIQRDPLRYVLFGFTRLKNTLWFSRTGVVWTLRDSAIFHPDPKLARRLTELSTHVWRFLVVLSLLGLLPLAQRIGQYRKAGASDSDATETPLEASGQELAFADPAFSAVKTSAASSALECLLLMWLYIAVWLVVHFLVMTASDRYAIQIAPLVIMLASGGLTTLWQMLPLSKQKPGSAAPPALESLQP